MATATKTSLRTPLDNLYQWENELATKVYLNQPLGGEWHTWTWKEFGTEVRKMAAVIRARGIEPGSRIALVSKNCAHWLMSDLAIMMSGCISVPIYPNVNADTVSYILKHSAAKLLFVGKLEAHDWREMKKGVPAGMDCISFGIYGLDEQDYPTWDEVAAEVEPMTENPRPSPEDVMTIIYTSGTTGTPKGVVHKYISPAYASQAIFSEFGIGQNDRFFSYLPLSHIAERMLVMMGTTGSGASVHFAESLDTFAENLRTCRPTVFLAVPRIWAKFQTGVFAKFSPSRLNLLLSIPLLGGILRKKIRAALGLDQAKTLLTGAAPIPVSLLKWYDKLGMTIYEVYGMTENSAYSHSNLPGRRKPGTVGQTLEGVETKITDEGEICVKSIVNMVEYYREPEKTAETLRDGWLHTGDKGEIDAEGYVRITGRVKDIFKTSKAKYVAPSPIEMKLSKNDFVEQVCVVGTGIPQPIALVVLSPDARAKAQDLIKASLNDTLQEVNPTLEHHERLQKLVVVRDEWTPENGILTPTLKIKRGAVDDRYQIHYEKWYEGGKGVVWE